MGSVVAQGYLLEVELALEAPPELDYLLLECPIPAGFEEVRLRWLRYDFIQMSSWTFNPRNPVTNLLQIRPL